MMQLTDGIVILSTVTNVAQPGEQPSLSLGKYAEAWYSNLNVEVNNTPETDVQGTAVENRRIRILFDARVRLGDIVSDCSKNYKITRTYAAVDSDSGMRIIDITMEAADYGSII